MHLLCLVNFTNASHYLLQLITNYFLQARRLRIPEVLAMVHIGQGFVPLVKYRKF